MVSIIITTYGGSRKLARAINSALQQTYKDIEIIVIDDNNPNTTARIETERIMMQFSNIDKIVYMQHTCNKNGATARNTGIALAKGEYLAFLDDDDIFLPDRVKKAIDFFSVNQCAVGVLYGMISIRNNKFVKIIKHGEGEKLSIPNILINMNDSLGSGSNIFVLTETAKLIHGFDERFYRFQDIEFMIRICEQGSVFYQSDIEIIKEDTAIRNLSYKKIEQAYKLFSVKFDGYLYLLNSWDRMKIEKSMKRYRWVLWLENNVPGFAKTMRYIKHYKSDCMCRNELSEDEYKNVLETWKYLNEISNSQLC